MISGDGKGHILPDIPQKAMTHNVMWITHDIIFLILSVYMICFNNLFYFRTD